MALNASDFITALKNGASDAMLIDIIAQIPALDLKSSVIKEAIAEDATITVLMALIDKAPTAEINASVIKFAITEDTPDQVLVALIDKAPVAELNSSVVKVAIAEGTSGGVLDELVEEAHAAALGKAIQSLSATELQNFVSELSAESVAALADTVDPGVLDNLAPLAPVLAAEALSYTDTSGDDGFAIATGTLQAVDLNGDALSYDIVGGAPSTGGERVAHSAYGDLFLNTATGGYRFVPNDAAIEALTAPADASFTITVSDGTFTASQTFTVSLAGANDAPVAANDSASGDEDTPIVTGNVLANDSDADSVLAAGSIIANSQGANGSVIYNGDGTFTYTPNLDFYGSDSFTYTLSDGSAQSIATVNIAVAPVDDPTPNQAPVAVDDHPTDDVRKGAADNQTATGNVLVNDSDPDGDAVFVFDFSSATQTESAGGTVEGIYGDLVMQADGTWDYVLDHTDPDTVALGGGTTAHDAFSYTISDGPGLFDAATLTIVVHGFLNSGETPAE